jgi:hypothetical protein
MKYTLLRIMPLALFFSLLVFACSDNEFPIFFYIENESEQVDNSLDNTLSITGMGKSGEDYYLSGGGALYTRKHYDDIKRWNSVKLPSKASYCTAFRVVSKTTTGDRLYAGCLMEDGTYALFEGDPNRKPSWYEVTDTEIAGKQIVRLEEVTGGVQTQLFAVVLSSGKYSLLYSDDGLDFSTAISDQADTIRNVTYSAGDTEFWAVSRSKVFTFSGAQVNSVFTEKTTNIPPDRGGYMGIGWFGIPFNLYYISTEGGMVYSSSDGDNWTASRGKSVSDEDVPFTFFSAVPEGGPFENVLVGTVGFGFYEMEDGSVASLSRLTEFTAHELYYGWVEEIFVDEEIVFCLTIGSGLWRNVFESGSWGNWVWE